MTLHEALTELGFKRTDAFSHSAVIGRMQVLVVFDGGDQLIISAADKEAKIDDGFYQVDMGWNEEFSEPGEIVEAIAELHMRLYSREPDFDDRKSWPFD
jgi:hypothetical protein